jgi:hypothetical protein
MAAAEEVKRFGRANDLMERLKRDPFFAKVDLDSALDPATSSDARPAGRIASSRRWSIQFAPPPRPWLTAKAELRRVMPTFGGEPSMRAAMPSSTSFARTNRDHRRRRARAASPTIFDADRVVTNCAAALEVASTGPSAIAAGRCVKGLGHSAQFADHDRRQTGMPAKPWGNPL